MRAPVVVLLPPRIHRGLGVFDGGERPGVVEQFQLQGLVPAFHLACGGRRVRPGEPLGDAVAAADPLEQHLGRARLAEPPGELPAVVAEHFVRDPVGAHRGHERPAHRAAGGPAHHGGDHAEPGVVIDAGDQLALGAVGQEHRPGDIQLPQLHRHVPLPPLVVLAAALALARRDQAVPHQDPVEGGPGRHRADPGLAELIAQPARPPPGMSPAQAADHRLDVRIQMPRLGTRPVRMIGQCRQTAGPVPRQPVVHRLARDPVTPGDLGNRGTGDNLHDRVITLLHDAQLHKHGPAAPFRREQSHDQRAGPGGAVSSIR